MASVPKTRETSSLEKHLICSICMGVFQNPVTTGCGHTFCKQCLRCNFKYNDRVCPLCKQPQHKTPGVNIIINTLVQQMANPASSDDNMYTGATGEVACDICTEQKLRAEKSCLVCLVSYCSTHLKNHFSISRLKSHKLVEPVKNLDKRACLKHGRPLELYSKKGEQCICVCCMEGDQEEFISTEKESNEKKAQIDIIKMELQQKVLKRQKQVEKINASRKNCTDQIENEWSDIKSVFKAVIGLVLVAQSKVFQPLKERKENVEREAKGLTDGLQAEISRLEKTISELNDFSALEDHIFFLQSYPSVNDMVDFKDCCETELDTSLSFGTMRKLTTTLLEEIQKELDKLAATELQRVSRFAVDVKFDPVTAHRCLIVSKGGKEVKDGGEDNRKKDDDLERFDQFGSVLGVNCLTSGKSYWEVEVSNKSGWDLGVARGNASRKGHLVLNPENGYWATVHYEGEKYAALTAPPLLLSLKEKPRKVGVFVDYEEGLVSFYDVMAKTHIYSFTQCSFGGKIFPYFSPHAKQNDKNADPLIISNVKHSEKGI
ncbi:E3 ubiquitin-protein ligase TRIM39-like isoform X1 [Takifugu flavidus]|uniref:Zinc-binding protein A33 n=1 Tax=Takifugu flavidus TaxID=433684 RepID=A0A5C6N9N5_9TELE|nr:E3 ubiquitin-protein ligase TRIM39-like isoform X1 [Takifugu flavidus]TWW63498.1 Zinc-binding protein A33 [Takifugu flavidus]